MNGVHSLCARAVEFVGLAPQEHLFFSRTPAAGAYTMSAGVADYSLERPGRDSSCTCAQTSREAVLRGEAALWCKWKHVGELTAGAVAQRGGLEPCWDGSEAVHHVMLHHGRAFYTRLMATLSESEERTGRERPNVTFVPSAESDSIPPSLPVDCRQLIGAAAMSVVNWKSSARTEYVFCAREVNEGKCSLSVNLEGDAERIVSLNVLRLSRQNGRILVRSGEWTGTRTQVSCKLPGE